MKRTHYTPGVSAAHGPFCCCPNHRPHLNRKETTMDPMTDTQIKEWIDLSERRPPTIDRELMLAALQTALRELRDLRAARAASRDRVMAVVLEALDAPGAPPRTSVWCQITAARVADALAAPRPTLDAARVRDVIRQAFARVHELGTHQCPARTVEDVASRATEQLAGQAVALDDADRRHLLPPRKAWDPDAYDRGACPSSEYVDGWNDAIGALEFSSRTRNRSADQTAVDFSGPQPAWRAGIEASIRRLEAQARKPRDLWHAAYFAALDEALVHLRAMLERGTERAGDTVAAYPSTTVDPDLCRRLAAEAAEDDARMTRAPWKVVVWYGSDSGGWAAVGPHHIECSVETCDHAPDGSQCGDREVAERDSQAIARTRNNLPEVAAQLTAAADLAAKLFEDREDHDAFANRLAAAQAECEQLRDENHRMTGIAMRERETADRATKTWIYDVKAVERQRDSVLASLHALLATEPAVSEERCTALATSHDRFHAGTVLDAVPSLIGAARQLHALRAGLQRIVGGEPAPRTWDVTPERLEALRYFAGLCHDMLAEVTP